MDTIFVFSVLVNYDAVKVRLFLILSREKLIFLEIFLDSLCPIRQRKSEESIGQSNRVLINITNDYNPSLLARSIRHYFERNVDAIEVLVFKGGKSISVSRELSQSKSFYGIFMKKYSQ